MSSLDGLIEYSLNVFNKLFNLELYWDYAIIEENTPKSVIESILMAYDDEWKTIIVNPQIKAVLGLNNANEKLIDMLVISNVAHEARHAWQHKQRKFKNIIKNTQSYGLLGIHYVNQEVEVDAYAFQEAVLKILCEEPALHLAVPKNVEAKIHTKSMEMYHQYCHKIQNLL